MVWLCWSGVADAMASVVMKIGVKHFVLLGFEVGVGWGLWKVCGPILGTANFINNFDCWIGPKIVSSS